jgi:hypothetical protein
VLEGVVAVVCVGVAVPPVLAGTGVCVGVGAGAAPPDDDGVDEDGVAAVGAVLVVVVIVEAEELALLADAVPPLGGAVSTGVVLGTL